MRKHKYHTILVSHFNGCTVLQAETPDPPTGTPSCRPRPQILLQVHRPAGRGPRSSYGYTVLQAETPDPPTGTPSCRPRPQILLRVHRPAGRGPRSSYGYTVLQAETPDPPTGPRSRRSTDRKIANCVCHDS